MAKQVPWFQRTIDEFHEKKGRGIGMWGDNLLLMTSRGARSGNEITTPLVTRRRGDSYVVCGSKGGAPQHPKWVHNIQVNPEVEIEVPAPDGTEHLRARARVVPSGAERDELYAWMTEIWPSFADYEKKTERTIPVAVLDLV
ncbi:MAG TPA: nitroreductase/quinone reductase family protein [Candidatus Dormibacteraeota bacterium]|nr:nitroreductase/quinone reductase family protein [Candidatus Dormibacteraeota bacterium]